MPESKLNTETKKIGGSRFLIIAIVLIAVLVLISIVFFFIFGKSSDSYSACLSECNKLGLSQSCESDCQDIVNYNSALESKNLSYCENINYELKKQYCLDKLNMYNGVLYKNPSYCKDIADFSIRNSCLSYLVDVAVPEVWKVGEEEKLVLSEKPWKYSKNFQVYDKDNNGLLDTLHFNAPDLDEIIYDILINKAEHLDSNKKSISDIYEEVKNLDNVWSEINENEHIIIKFEKALDNEKDITIYALVVSGNPKIEVYESGGQEIVAEFENITEGKNTIYLTKLNAEQDEFDLKVIGGSVKFDFIVDPITGCDPDAISCTNTCDNLYTPTVTGWVYAYETGPPAYDRCKKWAVVGCDNSCKFYTVDGIGNLAFSQDYAWYQFLYQMAPYQFYIYSCPSFESNGNFPVTSSNCFCFDSVGTECLSPPTYSNVFNFSSSYFCKNACISGQKVCSDSYSYKTCGLNGFACLNYGLFPTACPGATPYCVGAGTCVQCLGPTNCTDPGVCLNPTCVGNVCGSIPVAAGLTDTGCSGSVGCTGTNCRCNGAGVCVACSVAADCGANGFIPNNFICSGNKTQQKYRTWSCISNSCSESFSYLDTGLDCSVFNPAQTCYFNPSPSLTNVCCTEKCGLLAQCGFVCGGPCGPLNGLCPPGQTCDGTNCNSNGAAYWADMNGVMIGQGGIRTHSEIGDSVLLIYKNQGLQVGNFDFVIWEDDLTGDNIVKTISRSETFNYSGHLAAKWTINSSDFYLQSDGGKAEFYFKINGNESNILNVNDTSKTLSDVPSVLIKTPVLNATVRVGRLINFTQVAKDNDDDLKIKWIFEDGRESDWMLNCLTTGNCNTTSSYTSSGTKIIQIIAREMTRNQEAVNYSQVFAYDLGINVFPVISQPPFGMIFTGLASDPHYVLFNASRSYVANCTTGVCAGCYDVDGLKCYNLNKTGLTGIPAKYNLNFTWTFSENAGRWGNWTNDYDRVVVFSRIFYAPTNHWARLRVDYMPK